MSTLAPPNISIVAVSPGKLPTPAMQAGDIMFELSDSESLLGTSPVSPLPEPPPSCIVAQQPVRPALSTAYMPVAASSPQPTQGWMHLSLKTLVGCSEILGHTLEDRTSVALQQDAQLVASLEQGSTTPLRGPSQRALFTVAPLDVLVTRDAVTGSNTFHIIEINGTGIAGITNMPDSVVGTIMQSFSELPLQLQNITDPVVLVASSGQESQPPVSRTMHEKVLYCEALRRGFEATGRIAPVMNMTRLEKDPASMPASGPVIILGYMKQFRKHFTLTGDGKLMLVGRQVHAAINDRFVLNIMHQFEHKVDLTQFLGHNKCFTAGADKGVAYTCYNEFFKGPGAGMYPRMAPAMNFTRARTRDELVQAVQTWLSSQHRPVVIKPQGTGCGHGIEFFFGKEPVDEICAKVDASLAAVSKNYALACGGLPFTVCEYLDTASISDAAAKAHDGVCPTEQQAPHHMTGHKFELRIVVYRDGDFLRAYPSIAKVAREAFDPENPDKSSLINNITTSSKETSQAGSEFMLPLACHRTLGLLGIQPDDLAELCAASTAFIGHVLNTVEDSPQKLDLPPHLPL